MIGISSISLAPSVITQTNSSINLCHLIPPRFRSWKIASGSCIADKQTLQGFSGVYGQSVCQHSVREKTKGETSHLPYEVSFRLQAVESGGEVRTESIATRGGNDVLEETNYIDVPEVLQSVPMSCDVLFCKGDKVAVKHATKRSSGVFFGLAQQRPHR